jgi:hypothetical protein
MGIDVISDVCKNVAWIGGAIESPKFAEWFTNDIPENIPEDKIEDWEERRDTAGYLICGWTTDHYEKAGLENNLFTNVLRKDSMKVYLVNSSSFSDVGEHDWVVFSNNRKDIEEFLIDIGRSNVKIKDIASVHYVV